MKIITNRKLNKYLYALIFLILCPEISISGEIDGKGLFCKNSVGRVEGYYFDNGKAILHKIESVGNSLEVIIEDPETYKTDEVTIIIGDSFPERIYRDSLSYGMSFECEVHMNYDSFIRKFDIKEITKNNKI